MRSHRWLVFAALFAARTTIAYQFQSIASLGPFLLDALALDFATLGALIGCYMLPGVLLALPGGLLDQRFGAKRILILGLVLMAAGGLVMATTSIPLLFVGRVVSGAGAAILNVVLARTVSTWFAEGELAAVMGTFVASWPLGVALSLISVPEIAIRFGWTTAIMAAMVPSVVCAFVIGFGYRDPKVPLVASPGLRFNLSKRDVLLASTAGTIWGLYNAAYIIFVSALPDFLIHRGFSVTEASGLASILAWALLVSLPLGGYMSQKLGHPNLIMGSCFVAIAVFALLLAGSSAPMTAFAALAVLIGLPAGLIMTILPKVLAVDKLSGGLGIYFTVFYVALATLPGVAGVVRQRFEDVASPIVFGAGAMLTACLVLSYLMWLRSPAPSRS